VRPRIFSPTEGSSRKHSSHRTPEAQTVTAAVVAGGEEGAAARTTEPAITVARAGISRGTARSSDLGAGVEVTARASIAARRGIFHGIALPRLPGWAALEGVAAVAAIAHAITVGRQGIYRGTALKKVVAAVAALVAAGVVIVAAIIVGSKGTYLATALRSAAAVAAVAVAAAAAAVAVAVALVEVSAERARKSQDTASQWRIYRVDFITHASFATPLQRKGRHYGLDRPVALEKRIRAPFWPNGCATTRMRTRLGGGQWKYSLWHLRHSSARSR
jgi:hypothetical protein